MLQSILPELLAEEGCQSIIDHSAADALVAVFALFVSCSLLTTYHTGVLKRLIKNVAEICSQSLIP